MHRPTELVTDWEGHPQAQALSLNAAAPTLTGDARMGPLQLWVHRHPTVPLASCCIRSDRSAWDLPSPSQRMQTTKDTISEGQRALLGGGNNRNMPPGTWLP